MLEEIFHSIDLKKIHSFHENKQEENVNLDFKLLSSDNFKGKDDKKNLSKSISGFANSSGGIIIWGIDCRKNNEGIDCVSDLKPINNLHFIFSIMNNLISDSISPKIDNIKIEETKNTGYIKILVPESQKGPHMAKLGEDRYYKRSGDSFYKMEHYDIQDMFGKRRQPLLKLLYSIYPSHSTNNEKYGNIILSLTNIGRGIAHYPYLSIFVNSPYSISKYGIDGNYNYGLKQQLSITNSMLKLYISNGEKVIHINSVLDITAIEVKLENNKLLTGDVDILCKYGADDINEKEESIKINTGEIEARIR